LLASLALPDFRRLWLSIAVANAGRWAMVLAVGWLLQALTGSSLWVGASLFAMQGPALLIAPLAGVLADRFPRTKILALALASAAAASGALAVLAVRHEAGRFAVIGLTLVLGIAASFQSTAWQALLPNVVGREALLDATALQGAARQGSEFLGPAMAAPVLALAGPWAVFALCAVLYGAAALVPLGIRRGTRGEGLLERGFLAPIRQGVAYVRRADPLGVLVLVVALHCCLTMDFMGILPDFLQSRLHAGSDVYGAAMTAVGLGAILGVLPLTAVRSLRLRRRLYLISGLASGATLVAFGLMRSEAPALAAAVTVGASQAMFMAITGAAVQERCADAFRGRVSSVYTLLTMGSMALFTWAYGALGVVVDPGVIMVSAGSAFVLAVAVCLAVSPTMRRICALDGEPAVAGPLPLAEGEAG
jgi:MFS family permease